MMKFGKFIVKNKTLILIISLLLLIPSFFGMINTRINYDILTYLPGDIETVKGQDILMDDFNKGAFSLVLFEDMPDKDVVKLKEKIAKVDHVETIIWYDSIADITIPKELLPEKYYDAFNNKETNTTMMAIFFNTSTSADETMQAIKEIRGITNKQCYVTGMSALVTDLKALCEKEEPIYVAIAVVLATIAMMIFLDSYLIPFIFLASIGLAIVYNLGTNYFLGEVSYITKAIASVLQLGVTMDYSIFLWHSYSSNKLISANKEEAMAKAINQTLVSVVGSSITTVAGFIALCFMSFTLGKDLGIVMAKGVVFGVICCVSNLPALILFFDKLLEKTKHKSLIIDMHKVSDFIVKHYKIFAGVFVILLIPAIIGYSKAGVYYDLSSNLPEDMEFVIANSKLQDDFDIASTHIVLVDSKMSSKDATNMLNEFDSVDGVKYSLGLNSLIGTEIPEDIIPDKLLSTLKSDKYQLILINSKYYVGSDEVNEQISSLNEIIKKYDKNGMLIGEAACTKDLVDITKHDFSVVDIISIVSIFVIIGIVLKSFILPFILVAVIETAVFINLGIPFYTGTLLPFIAPICISTIQLGATVDYAILMTSKYREQRYNGVCKKEAISNALASSIPSIIVSAIGFFAATIGVAIYSDIDIISSLCSLMSRGAIISMCSVIFILPSLFVIFDKVICKTSYGFKKKNA